ncbi:uncharacterized protein C8A04DRAFT_38086 [Dichotomopilus funicola]|uniref:Uncharacterized protein n=1 Tax=Dichotomopilus funicola TaxID=1934379 RepID=A0AAN6V0R3_9PEZI|nr:hypothetical protein C8A04DRAFT_38086 [Dichotomopilus funicola]
MNRFNFFTARPAATTPGDTTDPYGDRTPLSPGLHPSSAETDTDDEVLNDDLEAARPTAAATAGAAAASANANHEMSERQRPTSTRFLHRFRPAIPSFFSTAGAFSAPAPQPGQHQHPYHGYGQRFSIRPSSSHYSDSGAGLRGAPDTVLDYYPPPQQQYGARSRHPALGPESPKSPDLNLNLNLPGTRLNVPGLRGPWGSGGRGEGDRDDEVADGLATPAGTTWPGLVAEPEPAVVRDRGEMRRHGRRERSDSGSGSSRDRGDDEERRQRRQRRREERSGSGSGSGRSRRSERSGRSHRHHHHHHHRSRRGEEGRAERRERRERRQGGDSSSGSSGSSGSRRSSRDSKRPPRNFLFCFPWVKSRRIRSHILRCFVSGIFLVLTLAIYLSLFFTKNINSTEFTIVLILIILFVTIFFCYSLVRLIMLIMKRRKREQMAALGQASAPEMLGPSGYAVPREPIPVVLARDEEAVGIQSEATKTGPPAYGVWRESVRVDPNRLYWMRNQQTQPAQRQQQQQQQQTSADEVSELGSTTGGGGGRPTAAPRPPSYSSDDGVSYVVEARPRSMAPPRGGGYGGLGHPSESGMSGSWV